MVLYRETPLGGVGRDLSRLKSSFVCLVRQPGDNRQGPHCLEWLESKGNRWDDLGLASWEANTKDPLRKQRIWRRLICLVKASLKAKQFSVATKPHQEPVFPQTL